MKIKSEKPASSGHVLLTPGENCVSYVGHHHAHSTTNLGLLVNLHLSSCALCRGGVEACNSTLLASKSWANGHFYSFCLVWYGSLTFHPIFFSSISRKKTMGLPVKVPNRPPPPRDGKWIAAWGVGPSPKHKKHWPGAQPGQTPCAWACFSSPWYLDSKAG